MDQQTNHLELQSDVQDEATKPYEVSLENYRSDDEIWDEYMSELAEQHAKKIEMYEAMNKYYEEEYLKEMEEMEKYEAMLEAI